MPPYRHIRYNDSRLRGCGNIGISRGNTGMLLALKSILGGMALMALGAMAVLPSGMAAKKPEAARTKKIVLIAGPITGHDKNTHEYERSVILLKQLLDTSPSLKGIKTEAHFHGWPQDEKTLDDADTIVLI